MYTRLTEAGIINRNSSRFVNKQDFLTFIEKMKFKLTSLFSKSLGPVVQN